MEPGRWCVGAHNYPVHPLIASSDADYTIFVWRQQQPPSDAASTSTAVDHLETPTLHLHDPQMPLPVPPAYLNAAYYVFQPSRARNPSESNSPSPRPRSSKSRKTKGSKRGTLPGAADDGIPTFKKEFEKFHGEKYIIPHCSISHS